MPAIVSPKSLAWTEPGSSGSLGTTTTSVSETARAREMSGEKMSFGTVTVASSEVPPLVSVVANVLPGAGSLAKLWLNEPGDTLKVSR